MSTPEDKSALQGLAVFTDSSLEWDDAVLAAAVRLLHLVSNDAVN